jgi:hypothetical protein
LFTFLKNIFSDFDFTAETRDIKFHEVFHNRPHTEGRTHKVGWEGGCMQYGLSFDSISIPS